jgi:hypothetical protein
MNTNLKYLGIILLGTLFSCSSKQIVPKYYVLEPIKELQLVNQEEIPVNVLIKPFSVSSIYDQKKIVFRSDSNELQYYYYHMWAEKPSIAICYFAKAYFDNAKVFNSCVIHPKLYNYENYISGYIDRIERIKKDDNEFIALKMTFIYTDKIAAIEHSFDRKVAIKNRVGMNVFSRMISKILTEEMNLFIKKIETNFKRQKN